MGLCSQEGEVLEDLAGSGGRIRARRRHEVNFPLSRRPWREVLKEGVEEAVACGAHERAPGTGEPTPPQTLGRTGRGPPEGGWLSGEGGS